MGRAVTPAALQAATSLLDNDHAARDDHNGCADDHHPAGYYDNRAHNYDHFNNGGPDINDDPLDHYELNPRADNVNTAHWVYDDIPADYSFPQLPPARKHYVPTHGDDSEVADHDQRA